jgi:oligopeptidase B
MMGMQSIISSSKLIRNLGYLTLISLFLIGCHTDSDKPTPPLAKKIPVELTKHGQIRTDNYYWLNQRENPDVIAYLNAENAYTDAYLKHTDEFRNALYNEITARIDQTDLSVPYRFNGYNYYYRYEEGKEYPVYCRKKDKLDSNEEIILNENELAANHDFFAIGAWDVSPDNKLIAYTSDTVSRRQYSVHVTNLETGQSLDDQIDNTDETIVWANDNKTLFYVVKDETLRPFKIYRHIVGNQKSADVLVFHETDSTFYSFIYKTKSQKYLVIGSYSTLSSEHRILNAHIPEGQFTVFQPREENLLYDIDHYKDVFYIRTNYNAANFRLMKTPVTNTTRANWTEVIPHRDDVFIAGFELFNGFLAISEKIKGLDNIRILEMDSQKDHYIHFDEPTYSLNFSNNPEFGSNLLRFSYSSLTTPQTIFDYNMITREKVLLKQQKIIGDFNPDDYASEMVFAPAQDGVMVPVSLVYKKGLKKNGSNPLWITGYGSYGYNNDPYFRSDRLSLLNRGFVFAIAHVRGGQELGRQWYENGKLLNKKNTFNDFIACTEFLISEKYTRPDLCFGWGGSAGGLLIGAVANMRPDLYKGLIAAVPFVDVVTTMLDESIPLTTAEYDEWGNPNEKIFYDYMLSYSPYDNVRPVNYPAILVTAGLHDSQVQYWEPAKWVAKLRDIKTGEAPVFLYTEMEFGHGGASGRFEQFKEISREYVFVLDQLGIKK